MKAGVFAFLLFCGGRAAAESVTFSSVADTTLSENFPNNNFGGMNFFNAGTTGMNTRNRGLLRFDLAGQIPPGSRITSADLSLTVTKAPPGSSGVNFHLHRLLRSWGEGDKVSSGNLEGEGAPAGTNEANWFHCFALTTNTWTVPGAAVTNDFSPVASAGQFVYDESQSPYHFSGAALAADVQHWLDHPNDSFGWLLKVENETLSRSARRFASHEDDPPQLTVEFIPPPQIQSVAVVAGEFTLTFAAVAWRPYTVESHAAFDPSNTWTTLTNISPLGADTTLTISDSLSAGSRFYRVLVP